MKYGVSVVMVTSKRKHNLFQIPLFPCDPITAPLISVCVGWSRLWEWIIDD